MARVTLAVANLSDGPDLVDLELDDGALLALTGLVGARLQATLHDDTHAALSDSATFSAA